MIEKNNSAKNVEDNQKAIVKAYLDNLLGTNSKPQIHINNNTSVRNSHNRRERRQVISDVTRSIRQGGIDKLEASFFERVNMDELTRRADAIGLSPVYERIGANRSTHAYRIGDKNGEHIYVEVFSKNSKFVKKLISNPNRFSSFRSFCTFLINLFGLNQFEFLKIKRIDFNVDLDLPYDSLRKMLRVRFKRIHNCYNNKSSLQTGMDYGSGDCKLVFYDKTEQLNSKGVSTNRKFARIELRYTGKRVPVEFIKDLPKIIKQGIFDKLRFFSFVSLEPFTMPQLDDVQDRTQLIKLVRLNTFLEAGGFDLAFRKLNRNGNFYRDYKGLLKFQESPHDLNKILRDNLHDFFGKRRVELL